MSMLLLIFGPSSDVRPPVSIEREAGTLIHHVHVFVANRQADRQE